MGVACEHVPSPSGAGTTLVWRRLLDFDEELDREILAARLPGDTFDLEELAALSDMTRSSAQTWIQRHGFPVAAHGDAVGGETRRQWTSRQLVDFVRDG